MAAPALLPACALPVALASSIMSPRRAVHGFSPAPHIEAPLLPFLLLLSYKVGFPERLPAACCPTTAPRETRQVGRRSTDGVFEGQRHLSG